MHLINVKAIEEESKAHRASIGGSPILADNQEWPTCNICSEKLILFFQFDITADFNLPFEEGSHFLVFMCPKHNDAPDNDVLSSINLPENYWDSPEAFYKVILNRPSIREKVLEQSQFLAPSALEFEEGEEEVTEVGPPNKRYNIGLQEFKVGGTPSWEQGPHHHYCSCGGEMKFVCQVPADYEFKKAEDAPKQPNSYSNKTYLLFLGNESYFFACEKQCSPLAALAIN